MGNALRIQFRELRRLCRSSSQLNAQDEVVVLKDRLAKGHRLNDTELAQLELAAVARCLPPRFCFGSRLYLGSP